MHKFMFAVLISSQFLVQSSYALSDCDYCLRFICTYKGSTKPMAQFQFGAEAERLEFERPVGSLHLNAYYDRSDENFVYFRGDKNAGYTLKASNSLYDTGAGDLIIELNGAPIENGEFSCKKE